MDATASVTERSEHVFLRLLFGISCAPWVLQPTVAMAFGHEGPDYGILCDMDYLICLRSTFEEHLKSLELTLSRATSRGLDAQALKNPFRPQTSLIPANERDTT